MLDDLFAPRSENPLTEAAAKAFDTGEADAHDFAGFTVEDFDARGFENVRDLGLVAGFEVVIAEDGDDGNFYRRGQLFGQHRRLIDVAVVGQVPGEEQDVGRLVDLRH